MGGGCRQPLELYAAGLGDGEFEGIRHVSAPDLRVRRIEEIHASAGAILLLIPGLNRVNPLTTRQLNRACHS